MAESIDVQTIEDELLFFLRDNERGQEHAAKLVRRIYQLWDDVKAAEEVVWEALHLARLTRDVCADLDTHGVMPESKMADLDRAAARVEVAERRRVREAGQGGGCVMAAFYRHVVKITRMEYRVPAERPQGALWSEVDKAVAALYNERPAAVEMWVRPEDDEIVLYWEISETEDTLERASDG
jgi:hypothetical protein